MSDHFRPTAQIASDVIFPSDPGLAMALAQRVTTKPLMANHHHGLWGYSGRTPDGAELTVQASGIGGPSAAVVLGELAAHGARRAIRVGRCEALDPELTPGRAVIVTAALGDDGTSRGLELVEPAATPDLTAALAEACGAGVATGAVAGCDLLSQARDASLRADWRRRGAVVADLETAAFLAAGTSLGLETAGALVVARGADGERDEEAVEHALLELGDAAATALTRAGSARAAQLSAPGSPAV